MLFLAVHGISSPNEARLREGIGKFFAENDYAGRRILLLVPDNTRSGPIGDIFKITFEMLEGKAKAFDVMVALGTHRALSDEEICTRLGITAEQRSSTYASVKFFNHEWDMPEALESVGTISASEIEELSGGLFGEEVDVVINKRIFDYDELLILGPVFPHEAVGFSGGHKYIVPGIAGAKIISFFHWLAAVVTNPVINGHKWTPTRKVIERAASFVKVPRKLFAVVAVGDKLQSLFIGDCAEAWERAADLSAKLHIVHKPRPFKTVLGIAPRMYDDMWTAGKVMYKLEPIVADGGMLIIYAPHITEISYTHGEIIERIGYHTRDYFLKQWERFRDFPRGALAHSANVKGIGTYIDGVERPRISVVLATGISRQRCRKVNLGYMDPGHIDIANYRNKEDKGILVVDHAGEMLYRLKDGSVPQIEQ